MAAHGLPMDKEGMNQRIFVHSPCTKKGADEHKALFFSGFAMCKRRSNQTVGFGQNSRVRVRRSRWPVRNVHENWPVHGNVNEALRVNESCPGHLFDGYLMENRTTECAGAGNRAESPVNKGRSVFDGYLMK